MDIYWVGAQVYKAVLLMLVKYPTCGNQMSYTACHREKGTDSLTNFLNQHVSDLIFTISDCNSNRISFSLFTTSESKIES